MSKGLGITRAPYKDNDELFFFIEDSNGSIIPIKQTFNSVNDTQIRLSIEAPDSVKIYRGELIKRNNYS